MTGFRRAKNSHDLSRFRHVYWHFGIILTAGSYEGAVAVSDDYIEITPSRTLNGVLNVEVTAALTLSPL